MKRSEFLRLMGATTVAAALSDFQAISQTVGTLKGGTVGADNLADELSSDLESQEAVVDKPVTAIVIGAGARGERMPLTRNIILTL